MRWRLTERCAACAWEGTCDGDWHSRNGEDPGRDRGRQEDDPRARGTVRGRHWKTRQRPERGALAPEEGRQDREGLSDRSLATDRTEANEEEHGGQNRRRGRGPLRLARVVARAAVEPRDREAFRLGQGDRAQAARRPAGEAPGPGGWGGA